MGTCSSTRSATSSRASARATACTCCTRRGSTRFGLPAENAAIGEGVHPRLSTERNIEHITGSMRRMGWAYDWDALADDARSGVLPLAAVAVPEVPRARARVPQGRRGQVVPERPDGARERAGAGRRDVRAVRRRGRVAAHGAVVLPHHGLRAGAARRSRARSSWPESIKARAAELDRPLRGRRDPSGSTSWTRTSRSSRRVPDTLYGATFFVLAPEHGLVARVDSTTRCATTCAVPARRRPSERAQAVEKTGVFTGLHAINPVNGERLPMYVADYVLTDYGTGAIMAVPAHDERDFDFATGFGLPVRQVVAPAGRRRSTRARRTSSTPEGEVLVNSAEFDGMPAPGGWPGDRREARRRGARQLHGQLPPARLGLLAAALLGLPDPGRLLRRVRDRPGAARTSSRSCSSGDRGLQAEGRTAARAGRGVGERALPALRRPGEARDRDDGHVRRLVLVLPALLRPRNDAAPFDRGGRRLLEPDRPLHRRCRPRDRAHDLRAVLDEGAERHRAGRLPRAVRALLLERLGDHRQDEDVEARGQRRRARRLRRALRRRCVPAEHPLPRPGERGHGVDRDERRGAWPASSGDSGASCTRSPTALRASDRPTAPGAENPRDHREGHRRHRPALRVQHGDRGRHGARERALEASRPARTRGSRPRPPSR